VKERLAVAISAAALFVAVLGTTSLGEAARDVARSGADVAKKATGQRSAVRGRRGPRGPRGRRGPRGFLGAPGEKGEKGDPGPSNNSYDFQWTAQVLITSATPTSPTIVAAPSTALGAGKYAVTAQVAVEGASDGVVYCRGREGRPPGQVGQYFGQPAPIRVGSGVGSVRAATLTLSFGVDFPQGGVVNIVCWETGATGATAGPGQVLVMRVSELTTIS
jgi:hypothetical protein